MRGKQFRQRKGVPIGGYLGAFYAIVQCARVEQAFLDTIDNEKALVVAYRYIDDCHIWMFASERDENARETERIRKDLWTPGNVYSSDLTVKEVSVEDLGTYHRSIFVGAEIRTYKGRIPRVELRPYCKNLEHIRRNGMQHYKMYKGRSSFTSDAVRYGSIMTAFCRIEMNSQTNRVW
jgi:hypothetical protein